MTRVAVKQGEQSMEPEKGWREGSQEEYFELSAGIFKFTEGRMQKEGRTILTNIFLWAKKKKEPM